MLQTNENDTLELKSYKIVRLKGLGSCGYVWGYETDATGVVNITKVHNPDFHIITDDMPVGNSYDEVFEIRATGVGAVNITFMQHRPWVDEEPHAEHTVIITVI